MAAETGIGWFRRNKPEDRGSIRIFQLHTIRVNKQKKTTKRRQQLKESARPRHARNQFTLLRPAHKRLNSYFEFRTVGLVLHNNIRKAMAVAWPMAARGTHSWAYWSHLIGGAARVYRWIWCERVHRSRAARLSIVAIVPSCGRAAVVRFATRDNIDNKRVNRSVRCRQCAVRFRSIFKNWNSVLFTCSAGGLLGVLSYSKAATWSWTYISVPAATLWGK